MAYKAVQIIESQAAESEHTDKKEINELSTEAWACADIELLKTKLLYDCDITLNFHPDRFSNNGKLIIENLLTEGEYHNQHKTGTSNGGLGGSRDSWEKRLFFGAYHNGNTNMADRPKYGALNIHNYKDGASARFGSCFFTVKPHVIERCTFAFGDSSTDPEVMGTPGQFYGIIKAILQRTRDIGKFVEKENYTVRQAVDYIHSMKKNSMQEMGRNLDNVCIETHIHGTLSLSEDIDILYVDEHYISSYIEEMIINTSERYNIKLNFIPKRRFYIDKLEDNNWKWKGVPLTRSLAERINDRFGGDGWLNTVLIGLAAQDSVLHPENWRDIGSEFDLFQNFKKIWHYCAYFG